MQHFFKDGIGLGGGVAPGIQRRLHGEHGGIERQHGMKKEREVVRLPRPRVLGKGVAGDLDERELRGCGLRRAALREEGPPRLVKSRQPADRRFAHERSAGEKD